MQPVYVKKAEPEDRVTWMDTFIALEPKGGFRDVVELAQNGRARVVFSAIMSIRAEAGKTAA